MNGWQVTAIIAIILVVILLVPVIWLGRDYQTMSEQSRQARAEHTAIAQTAATLEREVSALKEIIGMASTTSLNEVRRQHDVIMERALPRENPSAQTYHHAVATLINSLERERDAHRRTSEDRAQLISDYNNTQRRHQLAIDQVRNEVRRVEDLRDTERRQFDRLKAELDRGLQEAISQQNTTLAQSERQRHQLNEQVRLLTNDNLDIRDANISLAALLEDVRNPSVEHPAGLVLSIDQRAGTAIINVGIADDLWVRTMFGVYPAGISNLSFRGASAGANDVFCSVCQRDIARDSAKASVEVTQLLGPHRAEVRILEDILTDPIMPGDVIYSPIWKPGQRIRFALTAGMLLPGTTIESGTEAIKHLIEMNGGVVDCWINEHAQEGEDPLNGELSDLTNFIIVNERLSRELDTEVLREQRNLIESARNRAIKIISLEDLLSRMGWRNVTPIHVFGSREFTPEMRVVPLHPGTIRQSPNAVAPIFTPEDPINRLNPRDATVIRTSPGVVAPIFNENAPNSPTSPGRTSDLFRPRRPVVGE